MGGLVGGPLTYWKIQVSPPPAPTGLPKIGVVSGITIGSDGTASGAVTYPSSFAYPTATTAVLLGINEGGGDNADGPALKSFSYTTTGFSWAIGGALPASTVSLNWEAYGD